MTDNYRLAVELHRAGRLEEAERAFHKLIESAPDHAPFFYRLAAIARQQGRLAEALDYLDRAEQLDPRQAPYPYLRGTILHDLGQPEAAIACYRRAIDLNPGLHQAYNNLAQALQDLGQVEQAIDILRAALRIKPDYLTGWNNLAAAHEARGDWVEAEQALRRAMTLDPDSAQGHVDLGRMLKRQDRYGEAIGLLRRAVELAPASPEAHTELGLLLFYAGEQDQGLQYIRHALELRPDAKTHSILLFLLHYHPRLTAAAIFREHIEWSSRHAAHLATLCRSHDNPADPDRRLRIGYVSPDFRRHAVALFLRPIIAGHDRSRFEVHCYSDVERPDSLTDWFRHHTDVWHAIRGLADADLTERLRADGIDILIDLAGHSSGNRLLTFARRPAPVQASYLGYLGTTGMTASGYRLTDAVETPPGSGEARHVEALVRLPRGMWCFSPPEEAPEVSPPPVLVNRFITFASFNNSTKLNEDVITVWADLLRRLPTSRLLMVSRGDPPSRTRFLGLFEQRGIHPDRILIRNTVGFADFLAMHAETDIMLDPFPYSGGATSCLALWMGLPLVTLTGDRPFSRSSASILAMLGLGEWIADTAEAYVRIALSLAADVDGLASLRAGLRQRMADSPLMDATAFVGDLEQAYREMWRDWCQNQACLTNSP